MAVDLSDLVVFRNPDGSPFSMDPRWADSRTRQAWIKKNGATEDIVEEDEEDEEDDGTEAEEEEDEGPAYGDWTNDELRAELNRRKLSLDGKKTDLVARLEEDDEKAA